MQVAAALVASLNARLGPDRRYGGERVRPDPPAVCTRTAPGPPASAYALRPRPLDRASGIAVRKLHLGQHRFGHGDAQGWRLAGLPDRDRGPGAVPFKASRPQSHNLRLGSSYSVERNRAEDSGPQESISMFRACTFSLAFAPAPAPGGQLRAEPGHSDGATTGRSPTGIGATWTPLPPATRTRRTSSSSARPWSMGTPACSPHTKSTISTRAAMGTLSFAALDVQPLDDRYATVTGGFHLQRAADAGETRVGTSCWCWRKPPRVGRLSRDDTTVPCAAGK